MKRLALAFAVLSVLPACAGPKYLYSYRMTNPPAETGQWADDATDWKFDIGEDRVSFVLKNKTEDMLKVTWDEATIVKDGNAMRVMHNGVKFEERNNTQTASVIPPHASIEDVLIPTDHVHYYSPEYISAGMVTPGGWAIDPLFPNTDEGMKAHRDVLMKNKGQKFTVYVPVDRAGKRTNYAFEFEVADIKAPPPPPPSSPGFAPGGKHNW